MTFRWLHGTGAATKQPEKKENLNAVRLSDRKPQKLNNTITCFMQQHAKYTEDVIAQVRL